MQDCFLAESVAVTNPETPLTNKNLSLHKGASISGRVTESQGGAPIVDAFVYTYQNSANGCGDYKMYYSDDQGYYTLSGLHPGSYTLHAYADGHLTEYWSQEGNGYVWEDADPIVISTEGELISGKNFQLEQGAIISGKVINSSGQAIPEVDVFAFTGANSCSPSWNYWGMSDAQGEFELHVPPGQSYYIRTEGYYNSYYLDGWWSSGGTVFTCATAQAQLLTETGLSNVFFTLQHGATISGSVKDSQGTALAGVTVEAYSSSNPCSYDYLSGVSKGATTNANGQFAIQALPAGNYYLSAYDGSYILDGYHTPNGTSTDCNSAVAIPVVHQQELPGKDFTVQFGGRISGAIFDVNQDRLSSQNHTLMFYHTDPCSGPSGWLEAIVYYPCSFTYTCRVLLPGEYYIGAREGIDFNNTPETWWGFPNTVSDCASAQKVLVEAGKTRRNTDFYRTLPYGDVNNDGIIDVVDILIGLKVISGSYPSPLYRNMGDVNQNGVIDLIDTIQTMEKIAQ